MLYIIALFSGFLTILTPCVLPMLPILLGASHEGAKAKIHSYTIIFSLIISIFVFTLVLKGALGLFVNPQILQIIGAMIIGIYGLFLLFPKIWNSVSQKLGLVRVGAKTDMKGGIVGDIILGASLGPIFTSCTPTYLLIVGLILPQDFKVGAIALAFYCIGFGLILLLVAHFGRKLTTKLGGFASENSIGKKILGVICILLAVLIGTGYMKKIETTLLNTGFTGVSNIEQDILKDITNKKSMTKKNISSSVMYDTSKKGEGDVPNEEKIAYFAGGCFWCIEGIMDAQNGVTEAISGYAGGEKSNPTYEEVSSGKTKYREAVKVIYNPNIISYEKLVDIFFHQIDPTDGGGQFADRGFHYTPAIYYTNDEEKQIALKYINDLENSKKFEKKIAVKVLPYTTFYEAEDYHQDYSEKNSIRYNLYKKGSGRADFIEKNWKKTLENTEVDRLTIYTPEKLAQSKTKYNILFFEADWCSTCQAIKQAFVRDGVPDDMSVFMIDYDSNLELRKKYNVVTQSTFVLVDTEGNLIKRWIPALGIDDLKEQVETVSASQKKTYTDAELRKKLTPLQYKVTQEGYTEPPFENEYWDNKREGIYVDVIDGTPLFSSTDKFDSGTGWPSFSRTIEENFIEQNSDFSHGMIRTEVKANGSHLGHLFDDGPAEKGGKRYCINSAALKFIPKEELKEKGYEKYL